MTPVVEPAKPNRLVRATSPYLLQHARNPVDWFEWGDEAFAKARSEDKPIFLSIGYAACHWCHVMEHESFEAPEVAAALNAHFVSIKVDREERPDIDEIYMTYTQARTGHGGWPMSVWLTPDGVPFHAGTYFPKDALLGVLEQIRVMWASDRLRFREHEGVVRSFFGEWATGPTPAQDVIPVALVDRTAASLAHYFDRTHGGFSGGGTNKFPPSMAMDLMLRSYRRTGNADLLEAVQITLDNMARGGIYDHLGGGICRYSTDVEWLVPHFEKMLYDQAMVGSIFLDAYQATRNPNYADTAVGILDYVLADLQSPEGGFYSSRDADSEGLEGKFYLWTVEQVYEVLGAEDGKLFCAYYDVTETGNWFEQFGHAPPGPKNILHVSKPIEQFARLCQLDAAVFRQRLSVWRSKMLAARARRVPPALDDKILTGWNGLIIAPPAKAPRVLDKPEYAAAARRSATFLLEKLRREGRLLATYRAGEARLPAYLSDYAFLIEGLLNLYEADPDPRWLTEASALADVSIRYYYDEQAGGFFFTASDGEKLIVRSKQPQDNAIPAGNSVHAMNLLRLATLLDRMEYREKAESVFRAFGAAVEQSPTAYERLLCAVDFHAAKVREIAIVGDPALPATAALFRTVYERYLPNKVVVHSAVDGGEAGLPLLRGKRRVHDEPTAYVCEQYNCRRPVTSPGDLAALLDAK